MNVEAALAALNPAEKSLLSLLLSALHDGSDEPPVRGILRMLRDDVAGVAVLTCAVGGDGADHLDVARDLAPMLERWARVLDVTIELLRPDAKKGDGPTRG